MSNDKIRVPPERFGILLLEGFSHISLASTIEPLRLANRVLGSAFYSWQLISPAGDFVAASDGITVCVDTSINSEARINDLDIIIVCSGISVESSFSPETLKWLKLQEKRGLAMGAVCTGAYVLARAGLLDNHRCSIHWENIATLREAFPIIHINPRVFSIDGNRYTSSGGTTPLDMIVHMIGKQHGIGVKAEIAEQLIQERIRAPEDDQRIPLRHLLGNPSQKLLAAVELMEANLEEPISQKELADYIGLSRRQLERLFRKYLSCTPSRYYLQLRLHKAQQLLRQTNMSILEVSSVSGFIATSHFSKSYKDLYGYSPSLERSFRQSTG